MLNQDLDTIKDISLLYELSLSVGRSLNVEESCKQFLNTLMDRKSLSFASIWIREDRLISDAKSDQYILFYGVPTFKIINRVLSECHYIPTRLSKENIFTLNQTEDNFNKAIQERDVSTGNYAFFKLGTLGFLKIYRAGDSGAFLQSKLEQLKDVIDKFTISLETGLSYKHLQEETLQRRKVEEELKASEEKYHSVVRNIGEGLIITDLEDNISFVNESITKMSGYSKEEMLGKKAYQLLLPEDKWLFVERKAEDRKENISEFYEIKHIHKNGTVWWAAVNASPYKNLQGEVIGTMAAVVDVTDKLIAKRKQEELLKELEYMNQELQDFAYIVSHDLKAPLRGIKQLVEWISEDYMDVLDEDGQEQMDLLKSRISRLHRFIEDLLTYSKISRSNAPKELFDTSESFINIIDLLAPPPNIVIKVIGKLPKVFGEKLTLEQVFQNLLSNAIKYNDKEKGIITVSCEEADHDFSFSITDNGIGINKKYFDKIFQVFQTLHSRDTYESTGIGLSIVKKVIERHKGTITVKSEVDKGSTFTVTLPKIN